MIVKTLDDLVRARAEESDMIKKNGARENESPGGGGGKSDFKVVVGPDGNPLNPNAEQIKAAAEKALAAFE